MSRQNFEELLMPVMLADQTAVAGTTEGVLWAAQYSALPSNFFESPGKKVWVRAWGVMTSGATPGTLILTPRYGTTTAGTSLGAGTVSGTLVASKTNVPWFLDCTLTCRTISNGATNGTLGCVGIWECPQGYTTAPGIVECGQGVFTNIDTTASTGGFTIGATCSNAGTSLTCKDLSIISLN